MSKASDVSQQQLDELRQRWEASWEGALHAWSRFTKLSSPRWCLTVEDEKREHLAGSFAMIRLDDQAVVVSLRQVLQEGVANFPLQVLAHEIGHHVYVPGNLLDHGRMLARVRRGLPQKETWTPLVANLYADLLINDRLQRQVNFDMAAVYRAIRIEQQTPLWQLYSRTYEILWSLARGTLAQAPWPSELEYDAGLAARLIRSFAKDWLDGASRFAVLCLRYLPENDDFKVAKHCRACGGWCDTLGAGQGSQQAPAGLVDIDPNEARGVLHPMFDPELSGDIAAAEKQSRAGNADGMNPAGNALGQFRQPFEYGQILRALGLDLSDHEIAVQYYRERALPHLVKLPVRHAARSTEPLPEGLDTWDFGQPMEDIDWMETVLASPVVVPGVTTRQRVWGEVEGADPAKRPIDLDLYIDCSGSMPNPQATFSPVALAGAIVALSAMRVGSAVQATLWSGTRQFETTGGFVRDASRVLRVITGYLGGGTAFPIHVLRDTYLHRRPGDRAVHILNISDDGITTMFDRDEQKNSGWDVSAAALDKAGAGGSMVLNLYVDWKDVPGLERASQQGWNVYVVKQMEDLVSFATQFSRRLFQQEQTHAK